MSAKDFLCWYRKVQRERIRYRFGLLNVVVEAAKAAKERA
jgi:hypothetical protein